MWIFQKSTELSGLAVVLSLNVYYERIKNSLTIKEIKVKYVNKQKKSPKF